jgi:serine/threonine protein phosphatase PrpC
MDPESLEDFLQSALLDVDDEIKFTAEANNRLSGMGTTLTAVALYRNKAYVLHTGDSRAYRLRGKEFAQITKDHSVVQELIDAGTITEEEAAVHPQRSVLTNVLMGLGNITPVLVEYEAKPGDKFLLCSDGLSNVVSNSEIHEYMKRETAIADLIALTYERGAPDNVTIVIAEVGDNETATEFFGAAK